MNRVLFICVIVAALAASIVYARIGSGEMGKMGNMEKRGAMMLTKDNSAKADYIQGKNIYSDKCQFCHGKNGDGNGPAASSLSIKPADFTNPSFWQNNAEKKITDAIENGKGIMPSFDLKPDEIKAVFDYMFNAFKK